MIIRNPALLLLRHLAFLLCLLESLSALDVPIHLVFGDDEDTATTPPNNRYSEVTKGADKHQICDYDLCVAQEDTCQDIAAKMRCLCPGITPEFVPPLPPEVKGVSSTEAGWVFVHWCAPYSFVTEYRVFVEGKDGKSQPMFVANTFRNTTLADVQVGQRICVQAMNSAGMSSLTEESCSTYRPQKVANTPLLAGVVAGGVGFILLSVTALILWRRKSCCKGETDNVQGLGNPSFSNDGTLKSGFLWT